MRVKYYHYSGEKTQLKNDAKSRGESTIHDDFIDERGNATKGDTGRLTFDIIPDPLPRVIKPHDVLLLEFYKKEIQYDDLLDLLVMEHLTDHASKWTRFKGMFNP